jgi:cytochrome c peroxidase
MEVLMSYLKFFSLAAPLALALLSSPVQAQTSPAEQVAAYVAQSGQPAQAARGQEFFTTKHGKEWSCSTCHTAKPTVDGKHATTGKLIGPMAPAFNPQRFTDAAKTEKWFRRNCNDVVGRECSAAEKADLLSWLISLKS